MKTAVIYSSKYGSAKKYAEWVAEKLGVELFERKAFNVHALNDYDLIIFGGGIYAGGISGVDLVSKNPCRKLIVFTVGLSAPQNTDYGDIIKRSFAPEKIETTRFFHFRGGIDYKKLSFIHKCLMAMMKKLVMDKKPESERSADEKLMHETYGKAVDFISVETALPLVEYVNKIS